MAERVFSETSPAVQTLINTIRAALTQLKTTHHIKEFSMESSKRHRREVIAINVSMVRMSDGMKIEAHFSPSEVGKFKDFKRKLKSMLGD